MRTKTRILIIALLLLGPAVIAAQPNLIHYQARVQNAAGADIDGPVTVGLRIYDTVAGSTVLWGETQNLTAVKGIISVDLGAVNPLPARLADKPSLYLGITLAGDSEMTPRSRLLSVWKTMSASKVSGNAIQAGGATFTVSGEAKGSIFVPFTHSFRAPPVMVTVGAPHDLIGGVAFIPVRVSSITTGGCTVHFQAVGGGLAGGSADFDWIAVGR